MIRAVVVDDQALVRDGIRHILALTPDIRVVAEGRDGAEAVRVIVDARPDIALLDVRMPRVDGVDALRRLRASRASSVPVILLTTFDDDRPLVDGIRAGARGFLLKDVSSERLADGIRVVARGGTCIQPAVSERLLDSLNRAPTAFESLESPDPLTDRETEILRLVAAGLSNREIADAYGVSEGTVKNHTSSILSKLGVRDRTRAVLRALDRGYI
jgi:DNA-binding NarL/FixJ family response regulator